MRRLAPAVVLIVFALAGCGASAKPGKPLALPSSPAQVSRAGGSSSHGSHFVLMVMENRELGEVIGTSSSAPYLNRLARRGTLASSYYAIAHPSLPNYIALLSGSTLGISSDCTGCVAHGSTLVDQLEAAHVGWRAYMEGMPHACYTGASSAEGYAKKHDPFMYFPPIAANPSRCRKVVPLTSLASDLRTGHLPPFAWISPNLCDDGHDCGNSNVDRFVAHVAPYLLHSLGPHGVLAVVWDEGASGQGCCSRAAGGKVALMLAGPAVRAGYRLTTPADHYSLLGLIEDFLGVPRLAGAACPCTPSLDGAFKNNTPPHT